MPGNSVAGRRWLALGIVVAGVFANISCSRPTQEEIEERAGRQSIELGLEASAELNFFRNSPSSIALCVYQLKDRQAFDSLRDSPDGMDVLLACEKFDAAVVGRERVFVNPGESRKIVLERRRGAKYVALAAGYCRASMDDAVILAELPPVTMRSGRRPPPRIAVFLECDRMLRDKSGRK